MSEATDNTAAPAQSHIIKRPRLTRLLDDTDARIIMLVAPAGYGKTTLAREWLESHEAYWYTAAAASADVAALAQGLARALAPVLGLEHTARIGQLFTSSPVPERVLAAVIDEFASVLSPHSGEARLVIDDYHLVARSKACEDLVDALSRLPSLRLLVTSRVRPAWASARRILYGELVEIGPVPLAMTPEEAVAVLSPRQPRHAQDFVALAAGWPAVIGLAALARPNTVPNVDLPAALYEYFAQELYQSLSEEAKFRLPHYALLDDLRADGLRRIDSDAITVLDDAVRVGFVTPTTTIGRYEIHPLLRTFLRERLNHQDWTDVTTAVRRIVTSLVEERDWDNAFAVLDSFRDDALLGTVLRASLPDLLAGGRLSTVKQHVERIEAPDPIADYAHAELAFRRGEYQLAEAFAAAAAARLHDDDPYKSRAFYRAGHAAHFADREDESYEYHRSARASAQTLSDRRNAVWGQLVAAADRELDAVASHLGEFEELCTSSTSDLLRLAQMRIVVARFMQNVGGAVEAARPAASVLERCDDPIIRTGFLNVFADALVVLGSYAEAGTWVARELDEIDEYGLSFALPHALLIKARSRLGERDFAAARSLATKVVALVDEKTDAYSTLNARGVLCRMWISCGAPNDALAVVADEPTTAISKGVLGEYLGSRALAAACAGNRQSAIENSDRVLALTRHFEANSLARWALAIANIDTAASDEFVAAAVETLTTNDAVDCFVIAYRGYPRLLQHAGAAIGLGRLEGIVRAAGDADLARSAGVTIAKPSAVSVRTTRVAALSPREKEVFELLAQGFRNKEIARTLYISEVTVKVHVRHILRKLGARTRTEAASLRGDLD